MSRSSWGYTQDASASPFTLIREEPNKSLQPHGNLFEILAGHLTVDADLGDAGLGILLVIDHGLFASVAACLIRLCRRPEGIMVTCTAATDHAIRGAVRVTAGPMRSWTG